MPFRNVRAWAFIPAFIVLVAVLGLVHGSTTANSIPASRAGISFHPTTAQQLAPPECAGMNLTSVAWKDNGNLNGSNGNDLLLGSDNTNRINGRNGNDCIVIGSRNNNRINGGGGNDVCIGNPTTRFDNCETEIIRGAAPAGFAQMEFNPPVETFEATGFDGSDGLEDPLESDAGEPTDPEGETELDTDTEPPTEPTPESGIEPGVEPTTEPTDDPASTTEVDADPAGGDDTERQ